MKKIYLLIAFFGCVFSYGQQLNSADRDPDFNSFELPLNNYFVNEEVNFLKIQSDGKILLVLGEDKLIRLSNNQIDTAFAVGNTGGSVTNPQYDQIKGFEILPDGKILVYGIFSTYNGQPASNIVRLNANGTIDATFNSGTGFAKPTAGYSYVSDIKILPNGKLLVCGFFFVYNGEEGIWSTIILNADGTRNNQSYYVNYAHKLAVQPDGKIIILGPSLYQNITAINNFSRFLANGTYDATFLSGSGFAPNDTNIYTYSMVVQPDGKIIVGGKFTSYNNTPLHNIVRLNANGTIDNTFVPGTGFNEIVNCVSLQSDGKMVVGGDFNTYNGQAVRKLVRLNADGSLDTTFLGGVGISGLLNPYSGAINAVAQFADGKLLSAGDFRIYNGKTVNNIVKLNADGTTDSSFANKCKGFDGLVSKMMQQADGKLVVTGNFYAYNGTTVDKIARLNANGTLDNTFITGNQIVLEPNNYIQSKSQSTGKILLSTKYQSVNGFPCDNYLIRLDTDGTFDNTFIQTSNLAITERGYDAELALAITAEDKIYVSGWAGDSEINFFARLHADGSRDTAFPPSGLYPKSLELQPDGKLLTLIKPHFFNEPSLFRLLESGELDPTFNCTAYPNSIKVLANGKILGRYSNDAPYRLNENGTLDDSFNFTTEVPDIYTYNNFIGIAADGKFYTGAGPDFTTDPNKIIRINTDGSYDADFNSGLGVDGYINDVLVQADGKLLVGGSFSTYFGLPENNIVRLKGEEFYILNGHNKLDADRNGCDATDVAYPNLKFEVLSSSNPFDFIANSTGNHTIGMKAGSYTIKPKFENPEYYTAWPATLTLNFPTQASPVSQDFCITANGVHSDLEIVLVSIASARPGFDARYKLVYKNKGTELQSGTVNLNFDDAVLDFVSAIPVVSTRTVNNLVWNFTSLKPFETREIIFTLNLNTPTETPALNDGNILRFNAEIAAAETDETPLDNHFTLAQTVVNSLDPNDKTCLEGTSIAPEKIGDFVHYVIRFENKGSAAAQNIIVADVIDTDKFDISTLIPVSGSHLFVTKIDVNKVNFIFENINLPFNDATNDGYVAFKIKTRPTLVDGDTFSNTASIYFDYNFPIVTNTATTAIAALANEDFAFEKYFAVYPNPAADFLMIQNKKNIALESIEIYNISGQKILVVPNAKDLEKLDVSQLKTGSYFLKINSEKGSSNMQFLKR